MAIFNAGISLGHESSFQDSGGTFDDTFGDTFDVSSGSQVQSQAQAFSTVEISTIQNIVNAAGQIIFEDLVVSIQSNFETDSSGSEASGFISLAHTNELDWKVLAEASGSVELISRFDLETISTFLINAGISLDSVQGVSFDSESVTVAIDLPTGRTLTVRIVGGTKFTPNIHS
jgi:hypothetical protein